MLLARVDLKNIYIYMEKDFMCVILIHSLDSFPTAPEPLPKRVSHRVRSSASCFIFRYLLIFLNSSNSCLRLHRLPVTSTVPSTFPLSNVF
jgi:hypothetical protein